MQRHFRDGSTRGCGWSVRVRATDNADPYCSVMENVSIVEPCGARLLNSHVL